VVDDVLIVGDNPRFEAFDGKREDIGDDEGVGGGGGRSAEEEAHYFDGVSALF